MIGSFWNLCRACPSMPVDKLHSEYRSTYRWHEYTGPHQEVVRRPPQSNTTAPTATGERANEFQNSGSANDEDGQRELPKMEPAFPRRKKHPELAYRHHEFLGSSDVKESMSCDRARSEERGGSHWRPSRRSKSEGPPRCPIDVDDAAERRRESDPDLEKTGRDPGLLRKAISKLNTEYRLQFAWPQGHISRRDDVPITPRKSLSMGALKPPGVAVAQRKRTDHEHHQDVSELEPLVVNDNMVNGEQRDDKMQSNNTSHIKSEYTKKFRPFSHYDYSQGHFTERSSDINQPVNLTNGKNMDDSWYGEVVELRKKAGEYKHRGWGTDFAPERITDIYNKQTELWDQVSQRSSLSALSLATTTHRSYTKAEKEQENNKRSSPNKHLNFFRSSRDMIKHHLGRTTGGSELDGLILSPTREKLEPTIPRKDDDIRGSQRGSPQKHSPQKGSPQKSAAQKRSHQKARNSLKSARSQSVGPITNTSNEKRSPKRQSRSVAVKEKHSPSNSVSTTRTPRPSSLNTTPSLRSKYNSVSSKIEEDQLANAKTNKNFNASTYMKEGKKEGAGDSVKGEKDKEDDVPFKSEINSVNLEPVIKSPPEPTRVKSPEQIMMRSPDPVNWTVPLDTGKTFTVTQNIREGEIGGTRPQSEVKAWTPPDLPLPTAQSAPPQLPAQFKEQGMSMS